MPSEEDAAEVAAACQDPEISRWTLVPSPYTTEDALKWIALARSEREGGSAFNFVVVDVVEDRLLGATGIDVRSDGQHTYGDAGYWLVAAARGRGHATRALKLVTRWALDSLALEWLQIVIDPRNDRSRRVAERGGYRLVKSGPTSFRGELVQFDHFRIGRSSSA